jgi:diguanylate cyclase
MSDVVLRNGTDSFIRVFRGAWLAALIVIAAMAVTGFVLLQGLLSAQHEDARIAGLVREQAELAVQIGLLEEAAESPPEQLRARIDQARAAFNAAHEDVAAMLTGDDRISLAESPIADSYEALRRDVAERTADRLATLAAVNRWLLGAMLLVIALVAFLVFRPLTEMIRRRTRDLVEARNSMAYLAIHDGLTGLHNRAFIRDQFPRLLKGAARRGERVAVIQVDLDRFKQINDTLGHAAGDFVLTRTAERIRQSCRASDVCARLGGDEFLLVLPAAGTTSDIDALAKRILDQLNAPFDFEGATLAPGASAGIAVFPVDADNADELLVHADLALYSAKKLGGGTFSFFSDDLRQELENRKRLERDIQLAIDTDGFAVHFQPQVSLADASVTGIEALLRWHHEERGVIAPAEFLPVAERCGLMPAIGRIVMRKAIANAAQWHRRGLRFGRLAINVSGAELREPDFTRFLFAVLEEEGLPPQRLSLEIVESVILDDEKTGIASKLRLIRAAGVHLELDDFGTGYASLSHVNPNEIDRLKIDRRFVQNINSDGANMQIVRAITELARGLGIAIIAEGAETEAELSSLLKIGCDHVQGYSIAFPMPEAQASEWLASRSPMRPTLTVHEGSRA